ncbi:MAG: hypothetical protein Q9161_000472 [Pseudevernia consocians]
MLYTMTSAGSTSSEAPRFSRRRMKKSLADELEGVFEDVSLSPGHPLEWTESSIDSRGEVMEDIGRVEVMIPGEGEQPTAAPVAAVIDSEQRPAAKSLGKAVLGQPPRKTNFIEHISPLESTPQPKSLKEHTTLMASKHNRKLIDRNADGFFNMETMPTVNDLQRRVQQSKGIAALQRTLVPAILSDAASSSTGSSHALSSTAKDSVKHPSTLRQVTLAELKGRSSNKIEGPYPYTAGRTQAAPRFSLGRDLVAAGQRTKLPEPTAPAQFVKLPTDPIVNFKRKFREFGLKITIPEPQPEEHEQDNDSGSITTVPDVDSARNLKLTSDNPANSNAAQNRSPGFGNGVTGVFNPNQCLESACPIKWAHAKGPYHHLGDRHNKIMTGLFGHSNPPPEIWDAYRNMIHLTCDGEVVSPDGGRPGSKAEEALVIAFAMFHFGELNGISGKEFHRRYAGRHMSSRVGLQSSGTTSSAGWCCSGLGIRT